MSDNTNFKVGPRHIDLWLRIKKLSERIGSTLRPEKSDLLIEDLKVKYADLMTRDIQENDEASLIEFEARLQASMTDERNHRIWRSILDGVVIIAAGAIIVASWLATVNYKPWNSFTEGPARIAANNVANFVGSFGFAVAGAGFGLIAITILGNLVVSNESLARLSRYSLTRAQYTLYFAMFTFVLLIAIKFGFFSVPGVTNHPVFSYHPFFAFVYGVIGGLAEPVLVPKLQSRLSSA